jgi:hypothetical protein
LFNTLANFLDLAVIERAKAAAAAVAAAEARGDGVQLGPVLPGYVIGNVFVHVSVCLFTIPYLLTVRRPRATSCLGIAHHFLYLC